MSPSISRNMRSLDSNATDVPLGKCSVVTLNKWIRNYRSKTNKEVNEKKQDWRKVAILTLSMRKAAEVRTGKQRARHERWERLQAKLDEEKKAEVERINNLWKNDLKDLDDFFIAIDNYKIEVPDE